MQINHLNKYEQTREKKKTRVYYAFFRSINLYSVIMSHLIIIEAETVRVRKHIYIGIHFENSNGAYCEKMQMNDHIYI